MELYPFQAKLIGKLRESLQCRLNSPLLVSPTGSGKTVMFAYLTGKIATAGQRTVILAHRKELIDQICDTLDEFSVRHGRIESGKEPYDGKILTHAASAFTLVRRLHKVEIPDYLIIDEAHHAIFGSTWGKIIEYWRTRNPKLRIIGVTATPERLSGEGLSPPFDNLVMGPTTGELIAEGFLAPYTMYAPPQRQQVDTSKLHFQAGDFVRKEAAELMDRPKITGNVIEHYRKHLNGAPTVAFCVSVKHAVHVAEEFRQQGYRATSIDGNMKKPDRAKVIDDFRRGQLNVMTSCDLVSEGFDVPGMVGAISLRPTESLALCLQQWGRCLRGGKEKAIILDHVGNSLRHGLPDDEREWSLHSEKRKKSKRDPDDLPIRQCGQCGAVNRAFAKECRDCGMIFPIKVRKIEEVDGELEKVNKERARLNFKNDRASAHDLDALVELGKMKGMKNPYGWANHVLAARNQKRRMA